MTSAIPSDRGDRFSIYERPEGRMRTLGVLVTVLVHAGVIAAVLIMNIIEKSHAARRPDDNFVPIEAGLAFKQRSTAGKKSPLPQKEVQAPVKPPDAPTVAHDANVVPQPKPPEPKKDIPPPEAQNPNATFNKFRHVDTGETNGDKATDESSQHGSVNGSEYGTLENAKGDPYVGELIGRMTTDFVVPSVVTAKGLETWGCVKIDGDGKITERAVDPDHKSRSYAFNSAVEDRLRLATDMDKPVPAHLKKMLIGKFVCATFRNE